MGRRPEAGFTDRPNHLLDRRIVEQFHGWRMRHGSEAVHHVSRPGVGLLLRLTAEFNQQPPSAVR